MGWLQTRKKKEARQTTGERATKQEVFSSADASHSGAAAGVVRTRKELLWGFVFVNIAVFVRNARNKGAGCGWRKKCYLFI